MENETGFNLENAIAIWRSELAVEPGITDDNLRELESHLREAIAKSAGPDSTEQAAFDAALKKLGSHEQIANEHTKENVGLIWRQRLFWMALAAVVFPTLLGLPLTLLTLATNWIQGAGYLVAGEFQQAVFWPTAFAVGPALIVGSLASLGLGRRLRFSDLIAWLARDWLRFLVLVTTPIIFYLLAYVMSDKAHLIGQWMKNIALSLGMGLGFVWLTGHLLRTRSRNWGNWILTSRLRLAGVLVLAVAPTILSMAAYLQLDQSTETTKMLEMGAGQSASAATMKLLLFASAILLYPSVTGRSTLAGSSQSGRIDQCSRGADLIWHQRVLWMCSGFLLFLAWGVVDQGFHAWVSRGIDQWWFRVSLGILVPLAMSIFFWKSARSNPTLFSGVENVFGKTLAIVVFAGLLAILQLEVIEMHHEILASIWESSPFVQVNIIRNWIYSLIWPGIMLGFFLWMRARRESMLVVSEIRSR